ncbi:MAG: amidohydrolase family protein [Phycisphaerales bacterium JB043]
MKVSIAALLLTITLLPAVTTLADDLDLDIAIVGGRVIDPETGFDRVANIGIRDDRVVALTTSDLVAHKVIDAQGLIVAPGFIDILASGGGFTEDGSALKVQDGVTTQLGMEGGPTGGVHQYLLSLAGDASRVYTHLGLAVAHEAIREEIGLIDRDMAANTEQIRLMESIARREINAGMLGLGFGLQYTPGASEEEVLDLFRIAAEFDVGCYVHLRYLGPMRPENDIKGLQEVLANAAATGARLQILHINSMCGYSMETALELIDGARAHGIDVMADAYPWLAGEAPLESAVFDEGWRERLQADFGDLERSDTGERLTAASFERYRADDEVTMVIAHFISPEGTDRALRHPLVMISSDGGVTGGVGHPRGSGTFAKYLRLVREDGRVSWPDTLSKITLQPAQRLEDACTAFRRKGRIQVGADADIVAFNPQTVGERATFAEPAQASEGIEHVIVGGVITVLHGELQEGRFGGRALLSDHSMRARIDTAEFARWIDDMRAEHRTPGVAVALVSEDAFEFLHTSGVRSVESQQAITPRTIFAIGSTTKSITSTLIAMLASDGALSWDDPVRKHVDGFQLSDPEADRAVTLEDLGSHRTGVGRANHITFDPSLSRDELVAALATLPSTAPFRERWQYQNEQFVALGVAAEAAGGADWELLVRRRIFDPLGMERSYFGVQELPHDDDIADAHQVSNSSASIVKRFDIGPAGPAGSWEASIEDVAAWLQFHLRRGTVEGERLLDIDHLENTYLPRISIPPNDPSGISMAFPTAENLSYALGWFVYERDGLRVIEHGGGTNGFSSIVGFVPEIGIGYIVLQNMQNGDSLLNLVIRERVLDMLTGSELRDGSPASLPFRPNALSLPTDPAGR